MKYLFLGDTTLLVISSLKVLVNQTITISCLFETGQIGVLFKFPDNIYCAAQYCSKTCGKMSLDCPNNQTYRLNATVSFYWHKNNSIVKVYMGDNKATR